MTVGTAGCATAPSAATAPAAATLTGSRRRNVAPRFSPSLADVDRAAVQLDDVADDGQAEAEAGVRPRRAAVRLPEAIEDERQDVGGDPFAGVGHHDLDVRVDAAARASARVHRAA